MSSYEKDKGWPVISKALSDAYEGVIGDYEPQDSTQISELMGNSIFALLDLSQEILFLNSINKENALVSADLLNKALVELICKKYDIFDKYQKEKNAH